MKILWIVIQYTFYVTSVTLHYKNSSNHAVSTRFDTINCRLHRHSNSFLQNTVLYNREGIICCEDMNSSILAIPDRASLFLRAFVKTFIADEIRDIFVDRIKAGSARVSRGKRCRLLLIRVESWYRYVTSRWREAQSFHIDSREPLRKPCGRIKS